MGFWRARRTRYLCTCGWQTFPAEPAGTAVRAPRAVPSGGRARAGCHEQYTLLQQYRSSGPGMQGVDTRRDRLFCRSADWTDMHLCMSVAHERLRTIPYQPYPTEVALSHRRFPGLGWLGLRLQASTRSTAILCIHTIQRVDSSPRQSAMFIVCTYSTLTLYTPQGRRR